MSHLSKSERRISFIIHCAGKAYVYSDSCARVTQAVFFLCLCVCACNFDEQFTQCVSRKEISDAFTIKNDSN